uniref:Uncharacterized protein n=1 Tax=Amphimedon queenslandica TaxID=400682 RepID=A0A1X7VMI5_AMPQE
KHVLLINTIYMHTSSSYPCASTTGDCEKSVISMLVLTVVLSRGIS